MRAVFKLAPGSTLPATPVLDGDDWFVFRITEREQPTDAAFTDDAKSTTSATLLTRKREEALRTHVRALRASAKASGRLRVRGLPADDNAQQQ